MSKATESVSRGVLYVATGAKYVDDAIRSSSSVRRHMPDLDIAIVTDLPERVAGKFEHVIELPGSPRHSFLDKVVGLGLSPFEDTLFLDADTFVCESCTEVFDLLPRFDLAVAHDACRVGAPVDCPESFGELNTGVLVFRQTEEMQALLRRWLENYRLDDEQAPGERNDQPSFRVALFESNIRFHVLTPEYNFILWYPAFSGEYGRVKIVHGKWHLERVADLANDTEKARVILPSFRWSTRHDLVLLSPDGPLLQQAARLAAIYLGLRTVTWPNFVNRVRRWAGRPPA